MRLLLGDTAMARLEEYVKHRIERMILAQYRHELRMSDIALPDQTAKILLGIVCEETARMPELAYDPRGTADQTNLRRALEGNNAELYLQAEADLNNRILSRTGEILNEEQYEALAKFLQGQFRSKRPVLTLCAEWPPSSRGPTRGQS